MQVFVLCVLLAAWNADIDYSKDGILNSDVLSWLSSLYLGPYLACT